jgi:peptidoglycan/LPS O-acetylase OafA/YrhL
VQVYQIATRSQTLYLPELDGLRFVAFLLVFVHHLPRPASAVGAFIHDQGWVGVHIFLFLSAYLLTGILRSEQELKGVIAIKRFLIRRALRIWPLYFTFAGLAVLWTIARTGASSHLPHILGLALFAENWVSGALGYSTVAYTAHLWTISLEEQFYLLLPLALARCLASPRPRALTIVVVALWLVFVAARAVAVVVDAPDLWIWTSLFSADALLLGTWLGARRASVSQPWSKAVCLAVGAFALASPGLLPSLDRSGWQQVPAYTFIAMGAALVCVASVGSAGLRPILASSVARYLGKISYGLYVFHLLTIHVAEGVARRVGSNAWWFIALLAFVLTVAISTVSYSVLEKPFLRFKRRFEVIQTRPL